MTKGTYIIETCLFESQTIQIGHIGSIHFQSGIYWYVGSAMGRDGSSTCLEKRITRHLNSRFQLSKEVLDDIKIPPKKHWHIDYLLANPNIIVNKILILPSIEKIECEIANIISENADGSIKKFGCSDCGCESHLFYFKEDKLCFN